MLCAVFLTAWISGCLVRLALVVCRDPGLVASISETLQRAVVVRENLVYYYRSEEELSDKSKTQASSKHTQICAGLTNTSIDCVTVTRQDQAALVRSGAVVAAVREVSTANQSAAELCQTDMLSALETIFDTHRA